MGTKQNGIKSTHFHQCKECLGVDALYTSSESSIKFCAATIHLHLVLLSTLHSGYIYSCNAMVNPWHCGWEAMLLLKWLWIIRLTLSSLLFYQVSDIHSKIFKYRYTSAIQQSNMLFNQIWRTFCFILKFFHLHSAMQLDRWCYYRLHIDNYVYTVQ